MISLGLLIVGCAVIAFGFLDRAPDGKPFVYLALATRVVEAIGCILFNVSNFTAVAALFPDSVAASFSILQTGYGIGLLAGPTIGALLYDVGGFTLPFVVLGSFLLLGAAASSAVLPRAASKLSPDGSLLNDQDEQTTKRTSNDTDAERTGMLSLVRSVSCLLDLAAIVVTFAFIGFNAAALEPHLRQFKLSVVLIGFLFIIDGGVFAALSPLVGKLCDAGVEPKLLIVCGHLVACVGISLIGPLAVLPLQT